MSDEDGVLGYECWEVGSFGVIFLGYCASKEVSREEK